MGFNISGLVVTVCDPELAPDVADAIRAAGPFTLGEQFGPRLTLTLETDDHSAADWYDWLNRLPGVAKADLAFVYFDPGEEVPHV